MNPKKEAVDFIVIFFKSEGVGVNAGQSWYAENKSTNRAINLTVKFQENAGPPLGREWSESFLLEPGEIKFLRYKSFSGWPPVNAMKVGARYI